MEAAALIIVLVIVLALFFDFTNGFHDTANAMATPIATGALKPKVAVLLAAVPEPRRRVPVDRGGQDDLGRHHPRGSRSTASIFPAIIFAGLIGAITWNMLTWLLGLPSSSSHALFGGLIGATLVGRRASRRSTSASCMSKVILPALIAPLTAGIIAFAATKIAYAITRRYDAKPDGRDGFRVGPDLHVVARRARARHQRRAEDDGRHHPRC